MRDGLHSTQRKMLSDAIKQIQGSVAPKTAPEPKPKTPVSEADAALVQRLDEMDLDRKFDVVVQGLNLTGKQRELAREVYGKDKPDDTAAWVKEIGEVFGISDTPTLPTQEQSRPGAGAPATTRTQNTPTKMRNWSTADRDAYLKSKGVNVKDLNQMQYKSIFKDLTARYEAEIEADGVKYALVDRE